MMTANATFLEQAEIVPMLSNTVTSSTSLRWVSMKGYERATIIISALNATTVTGVAVGLLAATDVSGDGDVTLPFTTVYENLDVAGGDPLAAAAVVSNTFNTGAVNSKEMLYVIELKAADLEAALAGATSFKVTLGNATAQTLSVIALLWPAKYGQALPLAIEARSN